MSVPVLNVVDLKKRYAETTALGGVTFEVRPHEVVGLIGENGAGKSTLLKSLVGLVQPDSGRIELRGNAVKLRSVAHAGSAGIGMVFQEQSLIPNVTVAENILLGAEGGAVRGGIYRWRELARRAQVQLDKIGCLVDPMAITDTLSFAQRQLVEIAKVLAIEERTHAEPVVLLDEPTSVLDSDEIEILFAQIERLRTHASVVFVSHRLDEVMKVADRVYVLRNGQTVGEFVPGQTDEAELQRMMIGRDAQGSHYHEDAQVDVSAKPVRLRVSGVSLKGVCDAVSFDVRRGEVVGLAGVQGSGREELSRALFGAETLSSGHISIEGEVKRFRSPRAAIAAGFGFVPAERRREGMVATMTIAENVTLPHITTVCNGPFLDRPRERRIVNDWVQKLRVKAPSIAASIATLSGGNQQKAVLARWMVSGDLRVLILDHPTRGLDVGAKSEVYKLIRTLSATDVAIVLLADSLEETIAMSHRVIVMKDGKVSAEIPAPVSSKPSPLEILERMI
ncbi:sugar ABC transporter ATP-binding protein [Cryobacterium adonitolivorans]|uniref:Sugar ABC transporter ATP-binding protein n=1 Tax=Cryobacterium adonitolivorans TaxID=1259189 RepID=A0A4V3ICG4_9MICO|nr:sugar ABC transporter ATP-binding protein [Cryobacterium adonitolivorans]TFC01024.1 sugar ABC transporter ATP-binding protein [Cryobacterium adonitolivorans]